MIVLKIVSHDLSQIEFIAKELLDERLVIHADLKPHMERVIVRHGELFKTHVHELSAKTKALLFPSIDRKLREMYPDDLPEVYSVPIIHMDWDQTLRLRQQIVEV